MDALREIASCTIEWAAVEKDERRLCFSDCAHVVAPTDVIAAKACDG